ncbi:ABC transporter ATP-binding protein [Halopenitus persicus]|uniref:ABC transporter ATP-binding protein n=1 Tax=Halopenitus persicus TaxID=1048396 RepID=UPI000BBAC281|nr:ABC transporter ATP-binding protein [Halopenitus persicus]
MGLRQPEKAFVDENPTTPEKADGYIKLTDLSKTFDDGEIIACDNINLNISKNDFVVFLGPSGCGKTTTLRMIAGLETPNSGSIRIDGDDVTNLKPKDRNLAFVFQNITLYPHKTVRANMRFGLDMMTDLSKKEKNDRVEDAAEMLGIEEMLDRKPNALSGGQQQRVSIGRAMVMEPAAFLLDEPFSALDANLRDQMQTEIKKLQQRLEIAMIFVTHDQEEAMTLGDKIVIMDDGYIQQVGSAYEIYNEPANQFVAEFIGSPSTNIIESTLEVQDDSLYVSNDLFSLNIPQRNTEVDVKDGETVSLGIRPEFFDLNSGSKLFTADISVIEPNGANDTVYLEASEYDLNALVDQGEVTDVGESVTVDIDPSKVWLFDRQGERLI